MLEPTKSHTNSNSQMKKSTIAFLVILFLLMSYFAFQKRELSLKGNWQIEKLVLDGQEYNSTAVEKMLQRNSGIFVDDWGDTIHFSKDLDSISAHYKIIKKINDNYIVKLSSKEKSLNGNFDMTIDTLHLGPMSYRVHVKLQLKKTKLFFKKTRHIEPWKPEFPRRGQV